MRNAKTAALILAALCSAAAGQASAHTLKERVGGYASNDGRTRQRVGIDATVDGGTGQVLTGSNFTLSGTRDAYQNDRGSEDAYSKEVYGSSFRLNRQITAGANQVWDRITETRALVAYGTDEKVKTRTWSAGLSHWLRHETIRFAVDLSRTVVDQPLYEILDFDSREIGNPTVVSSTGATLSLRHLATSRTVVDYTIGTLLADNRPSQRTGTLAVRQYFPALDGALHATAARSVNRGYVTTASTYGQVDAIQGELGWAQNLWQGALTKVGYRYYKEDETTRAYEDEKVFGSDTITVGLSQEIRPAKGFNKVPLTIECAAARYLTNVGTAARTVEAGLTAHF